MNNIKKFNVAIAIFFLTLSSSVMSGDTDNTSIHGSSCAATSLGQAINFGASWSQNGVSNPNTVASGSSFFVVCPVVIDADPSNSDPETDVYAMPTYQDVAATPISCVARRIRPDGTLIKAVVLAGDSGDRLRANNVIDSADGWFSQAFDESVSVVCAMTPQSTLNAITTRLQNGV